MLKPEDYIGKSKWELDTPCLVLDEEVLDQNIRTMQSFVASRGKQLRPHAKTHKCSRIASRQVLAGCRGVCVAKVSEAEVLTQKGLRGVLITSPIVTAQKIERAMACLAQDPELKVVVDNPSNARMLNEAAKRKGRRLSVLVDLDPGMGRTGAGFQEGLPLGRWIQSLPFLNLCGIQCYAGHVQHVASFEERRRLSQGWLSQAAEVFRQFKADGLPGDIFTGSGTGSYAIDCEIPELTDLQVGSYTLMDSEYLNIGSARNPFKFEEFPPALTLLATVISSNHPDYCTVDAGLKALYHHGGTPAVLSPKQPELKYEWWGDEHGKISGAVSKIEIGEVLEVVVSHCDPTVNLFDYFYVTRKGRVEDLWPIDLRGKCQ